MGYILRVLSSKEFDSLPYKRAHDSLGLADPKTNVAYVRYSAVPELNKYLINHELDHLVEEIPTDEFEGIRYKGFGSSLAQIGQIALPMIGTAIGGPAGGLLGGAAGGALGGIRGRKTTGSDILGGGISGGLQGLFSGFGGGAGKFGNAASQATRGFGSMAPAAKGFSFAGPLGMFGNLGSSLKGLGSKAMSGFGSLFPSSGARGLVGQSALSGPAGIGNSLASSFQKGVNPISGAGRYLKSFLPQSMGSNIMSQFTPMSPQPPQPPPPPPQSGNNSGSGFLGALGGALKGGAQDALLNAAGNLPNSLLGKFGSMFGGLFGGGGQAGALAAGQDYMNQAQAMPYPQVPPLPASIEQLRSMYQSGGTALGQLGRGALTDQLNQPLQQLTGDEEAAITRQLDKEQKMAEDQVRDLYRNLRPGTDPSSDTSFRRDLQEVQDQFARAKSDALAKSRRQVSQDFNQNRAQQIAQAIGADANTMQQLQNLAMLDVQQIATQLNIDLAAAQDFKQTFSSLGGQLILSSFNAQPTFGGFGGTIGGR